MELIFRITNILQETSDTKTFFLTQISGAAVSYKAGQFLTLIFKDSIEEVRRSYSLGSTPGIDEQLFITVKRKPNGSISRKLLDHYQIGDTITAIEPSGRFVIDDKALAKRYIFVTAGSGITPVFGMIKQLLNFNADVSILLLNQSRDEANIIYKRLLAQLMLQFEERRFNIIQLYSQPISHKYLPQRLNNTLFEMIVVKELKKHTLHDMQFYLCGPTVFMLMAQFTLKLLHCRDEQIHKEQFVITKPSVPPLMQDETPKQVAIYYKNHLHHIQVAYPTTILDAALQKGIALPYSCKAGICSTCSANCTKGKIIMGTNEVLTDKDIARGLVLTCTGYAVTNVELVIN